MIALYCIRGAGDPEPPVGLTGVDGAEVRLLETDRLGLWISDASEASVTLARLREHDRVARTALSTATPLPVRFGMHFSDEADAQHHLATREGEFLAMLASVEGRVEMGVRAAWKLESEAEVPAESGPPKSGKEYLERRRSSAKRKEALESRASAMLDELEAALSLNELPVVRQVMPVSRIAGTLAHLVHRSNAAGYRAAVEAAKPQVPQLDLAVTGPWAPYSFVGADGGSDVRPAGK